MSDVGKLLWRNTSQRNSRPSDRSLGNHTALQSTDSLDTLPLRPVSSPPVTPTPTSSTFPVAGNPFSHPQDEAADDQTAVMVPAAESPSSLDSNDELPLTSPTPDRPTLVASSSSFSKPPPPKPLGLPPPRTPPPRTLSPSESLVQSENPQEQKEFRWWHDWLCGCGEDEDRGGDNQVLLLLYLSCNDSISYRLVGRIHLSRTRTVSCYRPSHVLNSDSLFITTLSETS